MNKMRMGERVDCWALSVFHQFLKLSLYDPKTRVDVSDLKVGQQLSGKIVRRRKVISRRKNGRLYGFNVLIGTDKIPNYNTVLLAKDMIGDDCIFGNKPGISVKKAKNLLYGMQTFPCWIKAIDEKKERLLVTTKDPKLVAARKAAEKEKYERENADTIRIAAMRVPLAELKVGQERRGVIKKVDHYGALVDIGLQGNWALLHKMDNGGSKLSKPWSKKLSVGESITTWIKKIDMQKGTLSLTTKPPPKVGGQEPDTKPDTQVKVTKFQEPDTKVKVTKLPPGLLWQELRDHFGQAGTVEWTWVKKQNGEVRFSTPEMAKKAIETLNGSTLEGSAIEVEPWPKV